MKNTSRKSKQEEHQIVKDLEKQGYSARRQPGSGNRAFDLQHDVFWRDSPVGPLHIEDKYREESRWKTLTGWKEGADILTVREARGERMCFMTWKLFLELIGENEGREGACPELVSEPPKARAGGSPINVPQKFLTGEPKSPFHPRKWR